MYSGFDLSAKQIFWGNILLVVCCAFYLAWWLLAFRPAGAVKGMRSGWLLVPAFIAGILTVVFSIRGISTAAVSGALMPGKWILWGGLAAYFILFAITFLLLKRPVTVELFLIVGWTVLALSVVNALYGSGIFPLGTAIAFIAVTMAAAAASLICYVVYYNLGGSASYIVGTVPLLLMAAVSAAVSIRMAV
ncbi:hypothetical protein [Christensenella intestinihominis]|uniref:hypothetical protein n=1 Tax=Christensenella intestinihominis TaxID=1851429 RepID=UPI000830688B|nr:hypothetical protein [Christensenella intestinihominis]